MSCIYFQILWTLDTGSACSSSLSTGKRFIWVYQGLFQWNTCQLYGLIIYGHLFITFDVEATYYFKLILHPLDKTILINGTLIFDLLQVNLTRQCLHLMSPSFFVVCIYYGTRYARISVTNYASSVRITIFFLLLYNMYDACVSCCIMYIVTCYCVLYAIVCMLFSGMHVVIVTVFYVSLTP